MTPSLKKLCIYGLATGVGEMLQKQSRDEHVQWRALKLAEAGQALIDNCKIKIDSSMVNRVEKKIDQICKNKGQYDVVEMLSFLILGVQELRHYSDSKRLKTLEKRAIWFTRLFDPKLEASVHELAYKRYERWVK
ncbi:hypothetical protein H8E88_27885 [candidate division KSB1 bacterium]|nr:hypothetical protein [candidate division KSB1 bacterium]